VVVSPPSSGAANIPTVCLIILILIALVLLTLILNTLNLDTFFLPTVSSFPTLQRTPAGDTPGSKPHFIASLLLHCDTASAENHLSPGWKSRTRIIIIVIVIIFAIVRTTATAIAIAIADPAEPSQAPLP
jgi:uncharacterized integral membrane protein